MFFSLSDLFVRLMRASSFFGLFAMWEKIKFVRKKRKLVVCILF